ncbi:MAG: efflux RND transporter permease subunit, partial [Deltaproteobacteria bacterium]|nr:efflux RND transporter permease subunit [Deltaproteobacteria bacterium]
MKLAEWSVKNSLLVNLATVFLLVAGAWGLWTMRREAFPNINFDIVQVSTVYAGASPEQAEKLITIPIEKELKQISDVKEMVSVSVEGASYIFLTIEPDATEKDKIVNDIQRAVDRVDDLPGDLEDKPVVHELKTKDSPILEISLYGDLEPEQLRQEAKRLEDRILDVKGVSSIVRRGYQEPEFSVEVDPQKIKAAHLGLSQIIQVLANTNINLPGGTVLTGPNEEVLLRVSGEFYKTEAVADVILRSNESGYHIKVRDVAQVIPTLEEARITNRTDGKPSINLMVAKKETGDIIEMVEAVQSEVETFLKSAPPGLKVSFINDFSFYVKRRLGVLINNGVIGLALLLVPLVVFLNFRTALSAIVGIVTAMGAAFAAMEALGITINLMSLFGMIMVLGMLVDEDIVIAENIHRHIEEGKPSKLAAIVGTNQVIKAVVATVLTTIVAFLPLLTMKGIIGKFVFQIPLVVIITLGASLLQAILILPSHMADLNHMTEEEAAKEVEKGKSLTLLNRVLNFYESTLKFALRFRYGVLTAFFLLLGGVVVLQHFWVDFILFPQRGIEQFFVRVETPIGTPVEETTRRMEAIEEILAKNLKENELDHYVTQGGITQNDPNDPFTTRASHVGQVWVFLTPPKNRERTSDDMIKDLRPQVEALKGFTRVSFDNVRGGPPVGKPVAIRIKGKEYGPLKELAAQYKETLSKIKGVKDIKDDFDQGKDEYRAVINQEKLTQAGLSYRDVALAVRAAFDGLTATTIKEGDEEIDVVVRFNQSSKDRVESLESLYISNARGDLVPLGSLAIFERMPSIANIKHDDRKRVITVTANIDEEATTASKVNAAIREIFKEKL